MIRKPFFLLRLRQFPRFSSRFRRSVNHHRAQKDCGETEGGKVLLYKLFYAFFFAVTNIMKKHFHYRFAVAHQKAPIRERVTHTRKPNARRAGPLLTEKTFPSSSPYSFHWKFSSVGARSIFLGFGCSFRRRETRAEKNKLGRKSSSLICVKVRFVFFSSFSLIVISIDAEARSTL